MLDLNHTLKYIAETSLSLTGADDCSIYLLDEVSGELELRVNHTVETGAETDQRQPGHQNVAESCIRLSKPIVSAPSLPKNISKNFLGHTIIHIPIHLNGLTVGLLKVVNRKRIPFSDYDERLLSALAGFAEIALDEVQKQKNLGQEKTYVDTILTEIDEGIVIINSEQKIVFINKNARDALDLQDEKLEDRRAVETFQQPELLDYFLNEKSPAFMNVEIVLTDGRVMNTHITPIANFGSVISMQDITHLKQVDRIKTEFVHTVSHNLRSPLTAILGYLELLHRVGEINSQQQEFIQRIQLSVNNITALINDLLDLGSIEAGLDTHKELVDLSTIAQYSIEGLKNRSLKKDQQLIVLIPEKLPFVMGNPGRLRQVVSNLLTNAIQYTPIEGSITVSARADTGQVILEVIDNGIGIPTGELPFIFDKFFRGSNISVEAAGTGLGLAIVKTIVENHQGRIWVNSVKGNGTTFSVVLPIVNQ